MLKKKMLLDNFHFIARTAGFRSHSQKLESLYTASIISNIYHRKEGSPHFSVEHTAVHIRMLSTHSEVSQFSISK